MINEPPEENTKIHQLKTTPNLLDVYMSHLDKTERQLRAQLAKGSTGYRSPADYEADLRLIASIRRRIAKLRC